MTHSNGVPANLLIVDDDTVDVRVAQRSLRKHAPDAEMGVATDAAMALRMLRAKQIEAPYVIILDLNMPGMSGIEMLDELRADPELRQAVVFVNSTSDNEVDIANCYERNVAGYLVKGDSLESLGEVIAPYLRRVRLPA